MTIRNYRITTCRMKNNSIINRQGFISAIAFIKRVGYSIYCASVIGYLCVLAIPAIILLRTAEASEAKSYENCLHVSNIIQIPVNVQIPDFNNPSFRMSQR